MQEEIRFAIEPELIASILLTEVMLDHEALVLRGTRQTSSYTGYKASFLFAGDHLDKTPTFAFLILLLSLSSTLPHPCPLSSSSSSLSSPSTSSSPSPQ